MKTQGKIITNTNIQTISTLEGGILKESFVKEEIKLRKVKFKLSDINYKSEIENRYNKFSLIAKAQKD
ncbi:MAG: hypothetical protein R2837_11930 [Aliarcobacter sp.]